MASKISPEMLELLLPQKPTPALLIPRWGVVTSISPLRVQLAGDDEPLPFTPKVLGSGGMVVGRPVWCVFQGRDLFVVAQLGQKAGARAVRTSDGPAVGASSWIQLGSFTAKPYDDGPASAPIIDASSGVLTIPEDGRWAITLSLRWRNYSSAFIRRLAIVPGTSAPGTPAAMFEATSAGRLTASCTAEDFYTAGSTFTFWLWSDTSSNGPFPTETGAPPTAVTLRRL